MKNLLLFFVLVLLIPATLFSQVKINEVLYSTANDTIEIKNFGSTANISSWWFCALGSYNQISSMTIVSGDPANLAANELLVVTGQKS